MNDQRSNEISRRYTLIKSRQQLAIVAAACCVIVLAVMAKRPDLFFEISRHTAFKLQAIVILLFVNFTALNWRCPSCRKYLGHDLGKKICRKCGARLE